MMEHYFFFFGLQHFFSQSQPHQRTTEVCKNVSRSPDPVSWVCASHHSTFLKWQWAWWQHPYMLYLDSSGPCHFFSSSSWCWKESFHLYEESLYSLQEYVAYHCQTLTCKYNLGRIKCACETHTFHCGLCSQPRCPLVAWNQEGLIALSVTLSL